MITHTVEEAFNRLGGHAVSPEGVEEAYTPHLAVRYAFTAACCAELSEYG